MRLFVLNGGAGWFTTGTARTRRSTSYRIFYWLEVPDFVLVFIFLFCLVSHISFHWFVVCPRSDVISVPSLMYCVKFSDRLRRKLAWAR